MADPPLQMLDYNETASLLPYSALADAIAEVLRAHARGEVAVPERLILDLPQSGKLLVMPAADQEIAITKLVTAHPGNVARKLPTIQGEVVVMRAASGERLGVLDGAVTTARRTASLSLLAARRLAPVPTGPLLVVGAGAQARGHVEAFHEGLGVERLLVSSRTRARAESLASHAQWLGMEAEVVDDIAAVLPRVKLIVTATTSLTPVLDTAPDAGLEPDTMIFAVGAFRPGMAEISSRLVARSSVVVDTLQSAREEAGDLIAAAESGEWSWDRALPLIDVLSDSAIRPATRLEGPILFKSVGHALFDLASARLAFGE